MFGDLYQCPFVNITLTETPIPIIPKMKILLISDTHLGSEIDFNLALEKFISELKNLVEVVKPTHIFHLGDLVDGTFTPTAGGFNLSTALNKLNELAIPIYVIGGNHDRLYASQVNFSNTQYITLSQKYSLSLTIPPQSNSNKPTKIYFAHDLGNNYKARYPASKPFVRWIKAGCRISKRDWLICGHTHESFLVKDECFSCIGQFSPECNNSCYGIIEIDKNVTYRTTCVKSSQFQENLAKQDPSYTFQNISI